MKRTFKIDIKNLLIAFTVLSVLWILRTSAVGVADRVLIPLVSQIPDDSWQVAVLSVLLIVLWYAYSWKRLVNDADLLPYRLICEAVALASFVILKDDFVWYGLESLQCSYMVLIFMVTGVMEVGIAICKACKGAYIPMSSGTSFYSDSPAENDEYKRETWVENIVEKMLVSYSEGMLQKNSFTILISDSFGAGKTTALNMMKKIISRKSDDKVSVFWFKPWLSENAGEMTKNFFDMLAQELGADRHIRKMLKKYGEDMADSPSRILFHVFSDILGNGTASLEEQHAQISDRLRNHGSPIVILVDDVDRLQPDELVQLLKLIRDAADFPNIFYVIAADKEALHSTLLSAGISDPEFYMRKFFNLEIMFPADDGVKARIIADRLREFISLYDLSYRQLGDKNADGFITLFFAERYVEEIFRNSRDVVRFFNMLSLSMDLMKKEGVSGDVYFLDLIRITMIQMLDSETYRTLRDHGSYILGDGGYRYVLSEDAKKGIVDKIETRRLAGLFKDMNARNPNESVKKTAETNYPSNLKDTLAFCRPSKEDIIANLLSEMFPEPAFGLPLSSISYKAEYFKYFAGCYRRSQISDQEVAELLNMTEYDFRLAYKDILKYRNSSFVHKWKSYVRSYECDRIDMLKKLMIVTEEYSQIPSYGRKGWEIEHDRSKSFRDIAWELYMKRGDDDYEVEKARHCEFFLKDECCLRLQAVVLALLMTPFVEREEAIFKRKDLMEFADILSRRTEALLKNTTDPFSSDTMYVIRTMNAVGSQHWNEAFTKYLQSVPDPESWFYRFVIPYPDSFGWNYSYLWTVGIEHEPHEDTISAFLKKLPLRKELSDDVADLLKLSSFNSQYLRQQNHDTPHVFLKHALQWYEENSLNPS